MIDATMARSVSPRASSWMNDSRAPNHIGIAPCRDKQDQVADSCSTLTHWDLLNGRASRNVQRAGIGALRHEGEPFAQHARERQGPTALDQTQGGSIVS